MKVTSIIAIYCLFWVMSAFLVLPFGVRTHADEGSQPEKGHAPSAPVNFSGKRIAKRATVLSVVLFALFYLNYSYGWVTIDDLDLVQRLRPR
jgi:predicted secreted protein